MIQEGVGVAAKWWPHSTQGGWLSAYGWDASAGGALRVGGEGAAGTESGNPVS